jgi:hypothetical protein
MPAAEASSGLRPAPRCTIVTGPVGAARIRWMRETIQGAEVKCAVLAPEETAAAMEHFARGVPRVSVRRLAVPCLCCPAAAAGLPDLVRTLVEEGGPDRLFIDLPVLAAASLLAEFDALVRWPRELVVCLSADWAKARRTRMLSYFQSRLIDAADRVVEPTDRPGIDNRRFVLRGHKDDAIPALTLL